MVSATSNTDSRTAAMEMARNLKQDPSSWRNAANYPYNSYKTINNTPQVPQPGQQGLEPKGVPPVPGYTFAPDREPFDAPPGAYAEPTPVYRVHPQLPTSHLTPPPPSPYGRQQ